MKSRLLSGRALARVGLACAVALSSPVIVQAVVGSAAYAADDENKVSPEMAKPLQAAQTALKEKKYGEAMAKLKEADAIAKKSPHEQGLIEQMRLSAAVGADEPGLAAKAYDYLSQNGGLQGQLKAVYAQAIAGSYMKAKDLGAAATWYSRYFQAGGTDLATRTALAQAYFFNNDFANAQKATQQAIEAYSAAGQTRPKPSTICWPIARSSRTTRRPMALPSSRPSLFIPRQTIGSTSSTRSPTGRAVPS